MLFLIVLYKFQTSRWKKKICINIPKKFTQNNKIKKRLKKKFKYLTKNSTVFNKVCEVTVDTS